MKTPVAIATLLLALGCSTTGPAPKPASEFRNLRVLPPDIPREQLIATMRSFTRSLGVKCNACHVAIQTAPEEKLDFASDAKAEKRIARVMIQMTRQINGAWMERVEAAEGKTETAPPAEAPKAPDVTCWTCHRGESHPAAAAPPAAQ